MAPSELTTELAKEDDKNSLGVVMLLSNAQAPLAGTLKQALALVHELQSRGVLVSVLSKRQGLFKTNNSQGREGQRRQAVEGSVRFVRLPTLRLQPAWSFLLSFLVWATLNRKSFQIIHAHNAALGVIASVVGWFLGKKVVIKIPSQKYVGYLNGHSPFFQLRRWILTTKAERLIAVSSEMAQNLQEAGVESHKISLIYNGTQLKTSDNNFDRSALKLQILGKTDVPVALFVGRLVEEKGLDRLLRAWAWMPSRERPVLLIVGDGPLRRDLEQMVRALELSFSVRFLGHQADVSKFYAMADLFVLPSITEGLSNSLLEAMAAGVPAVASNVGGNKDVVRDRETGFLVDWDDTQACVQVLSTLLSDPGLRCRIGDAARKQACIFDIGEIAERYRQLYQEVLKG